MRWDFYEISAEFTVIISAEERIVLVKAVADEEYIDYYDDWWDPGDQDQWRTEVRKAVELGDDAFFERFYINFVVNEVGTWDSDDKLNTLEALFDEARREVDKGANDIMVAFTNQDIRGNRREWGLWGGYTGGTLGLAERLGDDVIVVLVAGYLIRFVHQHEYSHLFGAPDHDQDAVCIMAANYNPQVVRRRITIWCDSCYSIISANKWRSFEPID
jgi:hypothetical protein